MEKELEENIKIKIAVSLRKLLAQSKVQAISLGKDDLIADSYNTIALNSGIRKATVTNIFNAKSSPNSTTLILIIESMGYTLYDFSKTYIFLEEKELKDFKNFLKEK